MRSLDEARNVCERYHPGMCAALVDISLAEREAPGGPVLDIFRKFGGPGLMVPTEYGGMGVGALDAARIVRAMVPYSPSLDAATTRPLRPDILTAERVFAPRSHASNGMERLRRQGGMMSRRSRFGLRSPVAAGSPVPRQVVTTATESCSPWLCGLNHNQVLL